MKVCFIAGTLGRGGAERQLFYMLEALKDAKVPAKVLSLTQGEAYEKEIEGLGVSVEWVGRSKRRISRLVAIVNNIRKDRTDILQSTHFFTNIYAGAAGRMLKIPSIGAIRSNLNFEFASNGLYGPLQLTLPAHLICNSNVAMNRALSRGVAPQKIDLLENVVKFCTRPEESRPKNERPMNILFAGRFTQEKRPDVFIDLAARLLAEFPASQLRFNLAGDGPLRNGLERAVSKYGPRKEGIRFLGNQSDMSKVYETTDILILTSDHEGSPNVVLEAMSFGIPVVATRVGNLPEVLGQQRGFVVDTSDLDGLYSATKRLIQSSRQRTQMGETGRNYVLQYHSLQSLSKRLTDIYSKLAGDHTNG